MRNKLISALILTLTVNFTSGFTVIADDSTNVYVNENFEDYSTETIGSSWKMTSNDGGYFISTDEEEENKYLSVWCENPSGYSNFPNAVRDLPKTVDRGAIHMSLKARADNPKGNCMFEIDNDLGQSIFQVVFRAAGTLTFNEYIASKKFEINKWYNIEVYIDMDKSNYDAYLDGELIVAKGAFKTEGVSDASSFKITGWYNEQERVQIDIDDLLIEDYTKQQSADDNEHNLYDDTLYMFKQLEVIDERDIVEFNPEKPVKRGEFLEYLLRMSDITESDIASYTEQKFNDVNSSSPYLRVSGWAYESGIITMNEERNFYPDLPVTRLDAIVMLMRMAGYETSAQRAGGYPNGYISEAYRVELIKSSGKYDENLNSLRLLELLEDAFDINVMKINVGGESIEYSEDKESTFLKEYKKIEKVEGVMTANTETGIMSAASANKNGVEINKILYGCSDKRYDAYIGQRVYGYIDIKDNANSVLYIKPTEKNKVISFAKNDYDEVSVSGREIKYLPKSGGTKRLKVESPYIIYNGKAYAGALSNELLDINNGRIEYVDNNSDGIYEIIKIYEAEHIIFESYDFLNDVIFGSLGEKYELGDNYEIYRDSALSSPTELKRGDVLSVKKTKSGDEENYVIDATRNIKYGTITGVHDDEIAIDNTWYILSPEHEKYNLTVSAGFSGAFYTDSDGNILYWENDVMAGGGKRTAYIIKGIYDDEEEKYYLRLVNIGSGYVGMECAEKVRINGESCEAKEVNSKLTPMGESGVSNQIVDYWCNSEGKISRIESGSYVCNVSESKRTWYSNGKLLYASGEQSILSGADTRIMQIPKGDDVNLNDYCPVDTSKVKEGSMITLSAYNLSDVGVADIIIVDELPSQFNVNDSRIFISGTDEVLNSDDELVKGIKGYLNGKEVYYKTASGKQFPDFKFGSIISIKLNNRNELYAYDEIVNMAAPEEREKGYYTDTQYLYGKIKKVEEDGALIAVGEKEYPFVYGGDIRVFLADVKHKKLSSVGKNVIGAYAENNNSSSYVYVRAYRGSISEMYIYG